MSKQAEAALKVMPRMRDALRLTLDLVKADRAICERSFLPEPNAAEQQILTNYAHAVAVAETILAEVDGWMP